MTPTAELFNAVSLASLAVLCALALRKVFAAERFHALRVILLTALLWAAVLYLFVLAFPDPYDDWGGDPGVCEVGSFCISS